MRSQYYYEPPRPGSGWIDRFREPPLSYLAIFTGIALAILLIIRFPNDYGAKILILLIAFPIHEFAHAYTAYRLGDATPKYDGRLTLNPFAHLDLLGSILIMVAFLGWAKPVRFNPGALRTDPRTGAMIVAIAGPISNLILAVLMAMFWNALTPALQFVTLPRWIGDLFFTFAFINVALFFFNLIPLAPLDGFTVLRGLLPYNLVYQLDRIQRFSFIIFIFLFIFSRQIPVFSWLIFRPAVTITSFLFGLF